MDHRAHIVSRKARAIAVARPVASADTLIFNIIIAVTVLLLSTAAWLRAT